MIGHQDVGVKGASLLPQGLTEPVEISVIVFFSKEAGLAVVPTLHDMQGYAIEVNAGATGHIVNIAGIFEPGPFIALLKGT